MVVGPRSSYKLRRLLDQADRLLRNVGYQTSRTADSLVTEEDEPSRLVPYLISEMLKVGIQPECVEIRSPTLEDIFLNLAGKPLAEVM